MPKPAAMPSASSSKPGSVKTDAILQVFPVLRAPKALPRCRPLPYARCVRHREQHRVETVFLSPLGPCVVRASNAGLVSVAFGDTQRRDRSAILDKAVGEMHRYFAGRLRDFSIPLDLRSSPFERAVWSYLRGIPFGTTTSYGAIARAIGNPRAARAVGRANAANPTAIIVPCHRVIRSDGELCGYAGGLERKRWLLDHESACAGLFGEQHPRSGTQSQAPASAG